MCLYRIWSLVTIKLEFTDEYIPDLTTNSDFESLNYFAPSSKKFASPIDELWNIRDENFFVISSSI